MIERPPILAVDDHPENLLALEAVLEPLGHELVTAASGEEALQRLLTEEYALILLDVQMPGLDGFETAEFIKRRERTRDIPIIFLTAVGKDAEQVFRGYETGAVDYVFKPFDPVVLRSKVAVFLELHAKTRALLESEERFRAAFAHAPIGVALLSAEGRWERVNRALCRVLGRPEHELIGRPVVESVHPDDRDGVDDERRRLLSGEVQSVQAERRLVRPDAVVVPVMVSVSLVPDAGGGPQHLIAQVEDMTARKRAERERTEHLRERAARAEAEAVATTIRKLQSVTDAALAHLALEDLCAELLTRIADAMQVDNAAILLRDPGEEVLTVRAALGLDEEVGKQIALGVGEGFAGRVAARGAPTVLVDTADEEQTLSPFLRGQAKSLLGVPLRFEGQVTGVLHVGTRERREFTDEEASLLGLIADRAALAIEHARLYERERGTVETLQRSLLPERMPLLPGLSFGARYLPGGGGMKVGGDWYDAIPLGDGRVGLAMGDVVGHGLGAAALMGQLRNALRAYALERHPPAAVLSRLDRLIDTLEPGRMATLLYLEIEADGSAVRFASAGHLPPLVLGPGGEGTFLDGGKSLPLGVSAKEPRDEATADLPPGATLLLYTDGLVEVRGGSVADGLMRLRAAALAGPDEPDALCQHIVDTMLDGQPTGDDVAILTLRTTAVDAPTLHLDVTSDPRVLSSMRRVLGRWLREAGASEDEEREVLFACHEACSNVIEHGHRFGQASFAVDARRKGRQVDLTISDRGGWREPGETDRGRGIGLMRSFMDAVEVRPGPEGTTVEMRRRLAAAGNGKPPRARPPKGRKAPRRAPDPAG